MKVRLIDYHAEMENDYLAIFFQYIKKLQRSCQLEFRLFCTFKIICPKGGGWWDSSKRIYFVFYQLTFILLQRYTLTDKRCLSHDMCLYQVMMT